MGIPESLIVAHQHFEILEGILSQLYDAPLNTRSPLYNIYIKLTQGCLGWLPRTEAVIEQSLTEKKHQLCLLIFFLFFCSLSESYLTVKGAALILSPSRCPRRHTESDAIATSLFSHWHLCSTSDDACFYWQNARIAFLHIDITSACCRSSSFIRYKLSGCYNPRMV